jgi:hypothetical protein
MNANESRDLLERAEALVAALERQGYGTTMDLALPGEFDSLVEACRKEREEDSRARQEPRPTTVQPLRKNWHSLKTWPEPFAMLYAGSKTFEIRKDDRDFQLADTLILEEWDPETKEYTGRALTRMVTYITRGPAWGLPEGLVVMAVTKV